jgi:hypothetical protein
MSIRTILLKKTKGKIWGLFKLLSILCAISLFGFLVQSSSGTIEQTLINESSAPVHSHKPAVPMEVRLSISNNIALDTPLDLVLTVTPSIDAPNTNVQIILPDECQFVDGSLEWYGDIPKDRTYRLYASVIIKEGHFIIEGRALSQGPEIEFGKSDKLFIDTSTKSAASGYTLKQSDTVNGQHAVEIEDSLVDTDFYQNKGYRQDNVPQMSLEALGEDQIQIIGSFVFQNYDGVWLPGKLIQAEFWDADSSGGDDPLGTTLVSSNGSFSSSPISNIDDEGGGQDVYVRFKTTDGAHVSVVDNSEAIWYCTTIPTRNDVPDGWVDFGNQSYSGTYKGAYEIFDYLENGHAYWEGQGYDHGLATCIWPDSGTYVEGSNGYRIHIVDGDEMDEDVILHEYGHSIMYGIYGSFPPDAGGSHYWTGHYNEELALSEGWATYASCIVSNDQFYDDTTDVIIHINVENASDGSEWDGGGNGEDTESAVCGLLWDIYDAHNDNRDTISDGPVNIFDVFRYYTTGGHKTYTVHQFWDGWFGRGHDEIEKINATFFDHGIDKNNSPSCTITSPNGGGWYSGNITVSASSSDTDGAVSQVEFQYSSDNSTWQNVGTDTSSADGWSVGWDTGSTTDSSVWVRARAYDSLEYSVWDASDTFFGIDNGLPIATLSINDGAAYAGSTSVSLTLSASDNDSGVKDVRYSNEDLSWSDWVTFTSTKSWALSSGDGTKIVYCEVRDNAGNPIQASDDIILDITAPSVVSNLASTSHSINSWSSNNTVTVTWNDASDNLSGLDGYSRLWDTSSDTDPDQIKNIEPGEQTFVSAALPDGYNHYFHIRSVDNAGNWQSTVHLGPFFIAVDSPILSIGSVSPTDGDTSATFTYSVNYTDFKNDGPSFVHIIIDNGASLNMTLQSGEDGDFTNGAIYEYTLSGASLGAGTHTFQFIASDGTYDAIGDVVSHSGPVVPQPQPPPPPPGGGSTGGVSPPGITRLGEYTNDNGEFIYDAIAYSLDAQVQLYFPKGTTAKNKNGQRLFSVSIKENTAPPAPSADCQFVCLTYDIGPNGATFNPPALLTFNYSDSQVPAGVAEENLLFVTWQDGQWIELEGGVVDAANNIVTVPISHLTAFTVIAYTTPASFEVTGMTITPAEVYPDETVTVSVTVANTGDLTGNYTVALKLNNVDKQNKEITLKGGESRTVSFTVTQDTAGDYTMTVAGLTGRFIVKEPEPEGTVATVPAPEPAPPPIPTPPPAEKPVTTVQPQPESTPESELPAALPEETTPSTGTSWWLIVIYAAAGVIVVILGAYYFVRKRGKAG